MPYIEAEYADGFIASDKNHDVSAFSEGHNVFHDILHRLHESNHGRTVRVSLVMPDETINVDFTILPDNARPIRFKHMERDSQNGQWIEDARCVGIDFGYQYTDENGENQQEVVVIR